jgi:hypothetical protein
VFSPEACRGSRDSSSPDAASPSVKLDSASLPRFSVCPNGRFFHFFSLSDISSPQALLPSRCLSRTARRRCDSFCAVRGSASLGDLRRRCCDFLIGSVLCLETNAAGSSIRSLLPDSSPVFRSGTRSRARQSTCRLTPISAPARVQSSGLVPVLAHDFSPLPCSSRMGSARIDYSGSLSIS